MTKKKIIVVGGGASGLMAAGVAAGNGADVLLLEKMKTPARKIRISGKGRCNLSNSTELTEFINHFGRSGKFLHQSFSRFFSTELIQFFESQGLKLQVERGGRIFPAEADAPAVAKLLVGWARTCGVKIKTESAVTGLVKTPEGVCGVICNGQRITGDSVVIASGGASYPRTGSTGDGYRILRETGHIIMPIRPALVPLEIAHPVVRGHADLNLRNVNLRLYIDGKRKKQIFGELNLTPSIVTGPIILTISLMVVDALRADRRISISLDLKPALDDAKLDARLLRDLQKRAHEPMKSVLRGLVPQELVATCFEQTGVDPDQPAGCLASSGRRKIRHWLKDFRFEIVGYRPIEEAIITAGGVKTTEVNPKTMESKKVQNLYIVGELLDIQGDTGGYNLQAAFSTGWMAGQAASGEIGKG